MTDKAPPSAYILQTQLSFCACCGTQHTTTSLWAETIVAARMGQRTMAQWHRLEYPGTLYNVPIKRITQKPAVLPFCHRCDATTLTLSHFDPPPVPVEVPRPPPPILGTSWAERERPRPKAAAVTAQRATRPTEPPRKRVTTLADLEAMLRSPT